MLFAFFCSFFLCSHVSFGTCCKFSCLSIVFRLIQCAAVILCYGCCLSWSDKKHLSNTSGVIFLVCIRFPASTSLFEMFAHLHSRTEVSLTKQVLYFLMKNIGLMCNIIMNKVLSSALWMHNTFFFQGMQNVKLHVWAYLHLTLLDDHK